MVNKLVVALLFLFTRPLVAQHQYNKNPDSNLVRQFKDTLQRTVLVKGDSSDLLVSQFNYVLRFYPKMLVKNIRVDFTDAYRIVKTRPKFSSIFKAPADRIYKITFSNSTQSTLDSATIKNLSFNSQLGLIANQISIIEDLSTGGFFDFVGWYLKKMSHKARNRMDAEIELKTLEVGLGYQLLSLNKENEKKLQIDNWQNTKGFDSYAKYTRNRAMKPDKVANFISDLPIYVTQQYQ